MAFRSRLQTLLYFMRKTGQLWRFSRNTASGIPRVLEGSESRVSNSIQRKINIYSFNFSFLSQFKSAPLSEPRLSGGLGQFLLKTSN